MSDLLDTHQITLEYSDQPLQYILNMVNEGYKTQGRISYTYNDGRSPVNRYKTMYYRDGEMSYSTDDAEVAAINNSGRMDIVPIPDVNKFEYYNIDGTAKKDVWLDLYVYIKIILKSGAYYDKCLIHIKGENYESGGGERSISLSYRYVSGYTTPGGIKFGPNNESTEVKIIASPYYIRTTDNAVYFDIVDQYSPSNAEDTDIVVNISPSTCDVHDNIVVSWNANEYEQNRENDFNFKNIDDPQPNPPKGNQFYEYGYSSDDDHYYIQNINQDFSDFGDIDEDIKAPYFTSHYDFRMTRLQLHFKFDPNKIQNNLLPIYCKSFLYCSVYNFNYDDELDPIIHPTT